LPYLCLCDSPFALPSLRSTLIFRGHRIYKLRYHTASYLESRTVQRCDEEVGNERCALSLYSDNLRIFSCIRFYGSAKNISHCRLLLQYSAPLRTYYQIGSANIFTDKIGSVIIWHTNIRDTVSMKHRQWNGIHTYIVFLIAWKAIRPLVQDLYKVLITK
jgi:hypothetical protein